GSRSRCTVGRLPRLLSRHVAPEVVVARVLILLPLLRSLQLVAKAGLPAPGLAGGLESGQPLIPVWVLRGRISLRLGCRFVMAVVPVRNMTVLLIPAVLVLTIGI